MSEQTYRQLAEQVEQNPDDDEKQALAKEEARQAYLTAARMIKLAVAARSAASQLRTLSAALQSRGRTREATRREEEAAEQEARVPRLQEQADAFVKMAEQLLAEKPDENKEDEADKSNQPRTRSRNRSKSE